LAPVPDSPVATIASWIAELTLPGGRGIPSLAISAVTVAPTHTRRGIGRAMVEAELRLAASEGVPVAVLTVSESTLYGRYGFGPATLAGSLKIDTKRARWIGPAAPGRVDYISRDRARELLPDLHERVRLGTPGELEMPGGHWDSIAGTRPDAKDSGKLRAVQYTDPAGQVRGVALYSVAANHDDFTKATATITYLVADTPDAYAAVWRFLLQLPLVGELRAYLQWVDEPVRWMIDDQRAATVTVADHQYVRIIDVPAALEARTFGAPGALALDVSDPQGLATGRWILRVDDQGAGTVTPWDEDEAPAHAVGVRLGIAELSAAYLGGVSLATLAAAGRVRTTDASTATRIFSWHVTPQLSFWY
jgi:predicted acetyltransferase